MNLLEAVNSPVSVELRHGKKYYTYSEDDVHTLEKQVEALLVLSNKFQILVYHTRHNDTGFEMRMIDTDNTNIFAEITKDEHNLISEVLG